MFYFYYKKSQTFKIICLAIILFFGINSLCPSYALAQLSTLGLPAPGNIVSLSSGFTPVILRGIKLHPENAFKFDFIVDSGDTELKSDDLKPEALKLIKYFMASLTIPDDNLWVNLSPYEKDRIIPESLAKTDLGIDMLAQDYLLKQVTASLIYPEDELGKEFWRRIYKKSYEKYGTTNIPIDTFNKVWIIPDYAEVYVKNDRAFIVQARLKVMLEEDYVALQHDEESTGDASQSQALKARDIVQSSNTNKKANNKLASEIVREVVIPALEKEVNQGKNFAQLRQIYNSLILAYWFKNSFKNSIFSKVYTDKIKIEGVSAANLSKDIYEQYIKSFKKGICDFVKVEYDKYEKKNVPRKYFSGGVNVTNLEIGENINFTQSARSRSMLLSKYGNQDLTNIMFVANPSKDENGESGFRSISSNLSASNNISSVKNIFNMVIPGSEPEIQENGNISLDDYFFLQEDADKYMREWISEAGKLSKQNKMHKEVREILDKILTAAGLDPQLFELSIVGDPSVNACIIPHSSHIIVNAGLLSHMTEKNFSKDVLASILAHETGHILRAIAHPEENRKKKEKEKGHNNVIKTINGIVDRYSNETASDLAILSLMEKAGFNVQESTKFFSERLKIKGMSSKAVSLAGIHYPTLARRVARLEDALLNQYWPTYDLKPQKFSADFFQDTKTLKKRIKKNKGIVFTEKDYIKEIQSLNPTDKSFQVDLLNLFQKARFRTVEHHNASFNNISNMNMSIEERINQRSVFTEKEEISDSLKNAITERLPHVTDKIIQLMISNYLKPKTDWYKDFEALSYDDIESHLNLDLGDLYESLFWFEDTYLMQKAGQVYANESVDINQLKKFILLLNKIASIKNKNHKIKENSFRGAGDAQELVFSFMAKTKNLTKPFLSLYIDLGNAGRGTFYGQNNEYFFLEELMKKSPNSRKWLFEILYDKYSRSNFKDRSFPSNFTSFLKQENIDYDNLDDLREYLTIGFIDNDTWVYSRFNYLYTNSNLPKEKLFDLLYELLERKIPNNKKEKAEKNETIINWLGSSGYKELKSYVPDINGGKEFVLSKIKDLKIRDANIDINTISWKAAALIYYFWFINQAANMRRENWSEEEKILLKKVIRSREIKLDPNYELPFGYDINTYTENLFWALDGSNGVSVAYGFQHESLDLFGIFSWYRAFYVTQDKERLKRILSPEEGDMWSDFRFFDRLSFDGTCEEMADLMKMYKVPKHVINLFVYAIFYDRNLKSILPDAVNKFDLKAVNAAMLNTTAKDKNDKSIKEILEKWKNIVKHLDYEPLLDDIKNADVIKNEGKKFTQDYISKNLFFNKTARSIYKVLFGDWSKYVPSFIRKFIILIGDAYTEEKKEVLREKYGFLIRHVMPELLSEEFGFKELLLLVIEATQRNKEEDDDQKKAESKNNKKIPEDKLKNPLFDDIYGNFLHVEIGIPHMFKPYLDEVVKDNKMDFDSKLSYITDLFPEESRVRDYYLTELMKFEDGTFERFKTVMHIFSSIHFKEKYSLLALEKDRQLNPEDFKDPEKHLAKITEIYFPDPSYLRDDILNDFLKDENILDSSIYAKTRQYMLSFLSSADQEKHRKFTFLEDKVFELIRDMNPRSKKNILLWLMGISDKKPEPLSVIEQKYEINLTYLKENLEELKSSYYPSIGNVSHKKMLEMFLDGPGGVVADDIIYKEILDTVFEKFIPEGSSENKGLKTIFDTVLKFSSAEKKKSVLLALINGQQKIDFTQKSSEQKQKAVFIKQFLEIYGVIGVKLGQLLVDIPGLNFSDEIKDALSSLKDQANPSEIGTVLDYAKKLFPGKIVKIKKRLGDASIKNVFLVEIDEKLWVLKIKRPEVDKVWKEDFKILRRSLRQLKREKFIDLPEGLSKAIENMILDELNFKGEKINQETLSANMKKRGSKINCPVAEITINNTAILEPYVEGISLKEFLKQNDPRADEVLGELRDELLAEIFIDGVFHLDLHTGNVIISSEKINIIDLGGVARISDRNKKRILNFLSNFQNTVKKYENIPILGKIIKKNNTSKNGGAIGHINKVLSFLKTLRRLKIITRSTYDQMHSVVKALISASYLFENMSAKELSNKLRNLDSLIKPLIENSTAEQPANGSSNATEPVIPSTSQNETNTVQVKNPGIQNSTESGNSNINPKSASSLLTTNNEMRKGGIDFNDKNMNIKTSGNSIAFRIPREFENIDWNIVEGFWPMIISISPAPSVSTLIQ